MSSGPFAFSRQMVALDSLLQSQPSWAGLEKAFFPAGTHDNFDPGDDMKVVLYHFSNTAEGRRILEWLFDLTARAPFPHVGTTTQSAALAAAKHEARTAVGYVIGRAIADGESLWKERSQNHETPA
jgi:hypothetical protein